MESFFDGIVGLTVAKESGGGLHFLFEEVNLQVEFFFNKAMLKGLFGLSRSFGVTNDKGLKVFDVEIYKQEDRENDDGEHVTTE
jgi:hypothetical protein